MLISSIDVSSNQDKNRGSFPHKSHKEIAIGDILAFTSAIMYGIYATLMKKRIGDESRVDMTLFFGFVGLFNFVTLLPGFFILHFTGIETFELPPTKRILAIVLVSSNHSNHGCRSNKVSRSILSRLWSQICPGRMPCYLHPLWSLQLD